MSKERYIKDRDSWMLGEDIPDVDLFFAQIWLSGFVNEFAKPAGRPYKRTMTIFKGLHLWFYFDERDSYEVGEHIARKFLTQPDFAVRVNKQIIKEADKLRAFGEKLPTQNLSELTNKELWQYYKKQDEIHTEYYRWSWIPVAVDMFHNNITEKLKQYLRSINVEDKNVNPYLMLLTQPAKKSLIQREQEEFLTLAAEIYKDQKQKQLFKKYAGKKSMQSLIDKIDSKLLAKLRRFHQTYFYVKFMWIGKEGVTKLEDYLRDMAELIASNINPAKSLRAQEKEFKLTMAKRRTLIKRLKINKTWRIITGEWGNFMVTKIYRRYAQIYTIYRMQPILKEIAKRLKVSLKTVRLMLTAEIGDALLRNKINRKSLAQRIKFCVYYTENNFEKVYIGAEARRLAKKLQPKKLGDISEINGQIGCAGRAKGTVKIIIRPKDMKKMRPGDILVSIATDPDIVPAMKKAAAIVTDQGGITSHAAIVAREMNKPCVIGTKIATQVLKDGDKVEVDANKGVVKKIESVK